MEPNQQSATPQPPPVVSSQMAAQISSVPQENALEENKAGFIVRAAAAIVDGFLLGSVTIPMSFLALTTLGEAGKVVSRFIAFLPLVYQTLAVGLYGKTIGKYFFNLQVVTTNHTKPGMAKAFLREVVGKLLSSVVLSLGYFWIIWDKNKQGWHDKIANTFVIQEKPIGGVKKAFAYFFVLGLPILAILGIMAVVFLVATNPLGR